ncbi:alpha/beta-hydrolase, partial [Hortaea werneckii]
MNATDPEGYGDVAATNQLCEDAQFWCQNVTAPYYANGYDPYDIRQHLPSPDPPAAYQEYLNNASVLAAIGAKINYTESSPYVQRAFISTGDTIRGGQVDDLAYLLNQGIRVALIYGDADYICNWIGGQAVSLAVADRDNNCTLPSATDAVAAMASSTPVAPSCYSSAFPAAGYAEIVVNSTFVGGAVRQYGNLSFSRIYDSGHFVPFYQPETAFTVFTRIIQGVDISTGDGVDLSTFGTTGPANSTRTNSAPSDTPSPT